MKKSKQARKGVKGAKIVDRTKPTKQAKDKKQVSGTATLVAPQNGTTATQELGEASEKKLKVLLGIDCYFPTVDGVTQTMHNLLLELNKKHEAYAIAPILKKEFEGELPYKTFWCKSVYLPIYGERYPTPEKDKPLNSELGAMDLDIIHLHSPFAINKYCVKVARKKNIPIVATFHTKFRSALYDKLKNKSLTEYLCRIIGRNLNKLDEVFIVNESMLEELRSYGYKGKVSYHPLGTDWAKSGKNAEDMASVNAEFGINPTEIVFSYVGRLEKVKNIDFTLDALSEVSKKGYKFKFFLVGKGPEMENLKAKVEELNLSDYVIFTGFAKAETLKAIYSRTDVLLFPSDFDTFGLVKVEASAFNTPTLTLENSCAGYGITDNQNGYLIKNDLGDYVNKLIYIINNRQNILSVGKNAGDTLYINWEQSTALLVQKYREIIARHKANPPKQAKAKKVKKVKNKRIKSKVKGKAKRKAKKQ